MVGERKQHGQTLASSTCEAFLRGIGTRRLLVDARTQQQWTYGRFLDESLAMAGFLEREGVQPGQQVILSMENCSELAILYFACLHLNAPILPINPAFHPSDYAKILQGSNARLMIASPGVCAAMTETLAGFPALESALHAAGRRGQEGEDAAPGQFRFRRGAGRPGGRAVRPSAAPATRTCS